MVFPPNPASGCVSPSANVRGGKIREVSNWHLARVVAQAGQLGVVSGAALNTILVRRLRQGDFGGAIRWALDRCPLRAAARRIQSRYFIPGGVSAVRRHRSAPRPLTSLAEEVVELTIVATFIEVALAKHGHNGVVGLDLREKVPLRILASLFGAMLARVDSVLLGAGNSRVVPAMLDRLVAWQPVALDDGGAGTAPGGNPPLHFDPRRFAPDSPPPLRRPALLAIVSSGTHAARVARQAGGRVDGFVIERPSADGAEVARFMRPEAETCRAADVVRCVAQALGER
ncbi:MAG: hypothetical protein JNL92_03595 [Opitutaceae bacterium]|nr:hypothetical protein [Opitutaceae bacterium]